MPATVDELLKKTIDNQAKMLRDLELETLKKFHSKDQPPVRLYSFESDKLKSIDFCCFFSILNVIRTE